MTKVSYEITDKMGNVFVANTKMEATIIKARVNGICKTIYTPVRPPKAAVAPKRAEILKRQGFVKPVR